MRRYSVLPAAVLVLAAFPLGHVRAATEPTLAGVGLAEALERLRAAGLKVIYSSELVRPEMRVVAEPQGRTPQEILEALLKPHGLAVGHGPGGALLVVRAGPAPPPAGRIHGTVRASDTNMPLSGVEVTLAKSGTVTWSDRSGAFGFEGLPAGTYTLHVRSPGYLESVVEAVVGLAARTAGLAIELSPRPMYLQEVVVTPSQIGLGHEQPEARRFLDRLEVQQIPHLSDDLFRVVQWLPGTAAGDISAEFGLRGGTPDEVMFLLDGMQLHDPYHLRDFFSLFSIVDSELVSGVDVLSGGFPVEYGDRMSGVLELTTAIPDRPGGSVGVTGVHARALFEGVWDDGKGSWIVSARRGYLDWLLHWLARIDEDPAITGSPTYWDLYASARRPLGEDSVLSVHLLTSHDTVRAEDTDTLETANGRSTSWYLWATLFSSFGSGLSARTVASVTSLERRLEGSSSPEAVSFTEAQDNRSFSIYGLDQQWVLEPWRSHLLKWGADVRRAQAAYEVDSTFIVHDPIFTGLGPPWEVRRLANLRPSGWQIGLYTADRVRLAPGVTAEAGLRWDHQSWTPGDDQVSPRLNLVWETSNLGTVRASWGRFSQSQAIYELQVEDGINTYFPAQWAVHRVVSWERTLPSGLVLRAEGYSKSMTDLRPRFENLFGNAHLFPEGALDRVEVAPERAENRGIELLLKSPGGRRISGWVGYALSEAEDRIDGAWVPRSWDQRHAFSFNANWAPGRNWSFNLAGLMHSGWPVTSGNAVWVQRPDGSWDLASVVGERNADRVPEYRRIDLRISRSFHLRGGAARLFLEILNLTDHENVRSASNIIFIRDPGGSAGVSWGDAAWFPVFISLGCNVTF